jgi:hypothetical protein
LDSVKPSEADDVTVTFTRREDGSVAVMVTPRDQPSAPAVTTTLSPDEWCRAVASVAPVETDEALRYVRRIHGA